MPLSSKASISLKDIPKFVDFFLQVLINELFNDRATDADQGQNAAIRYAIIGGNTQGQFSIDSQNGDISLVKPLDYETMKNYRLVIRAQGS